MKRIKLLTIGNSFSENAITFLPQLAAADGSVAFEIGRASLGGCTLEKHWNLADYSARAPEAITYYLQRDSDPSNLQQALTSREWDYITLQQASPRSWLRQSFEPYLGNLVTLIRSLAPRAGVMLHQTWAYRSDAGFLADRGITQRYMYDRICENCDYFSARYNLPLLRSGTAVQTAREAPGRAFVWPDPNFNYADPQPPALPDQTNSLIGGWRWNISGTGDGRPELTKDVIHLNEAGCYLVGCLWFERLTGRSVLQNSFVPDGMEAEQAEFLRGVAHSVAAM